MSKSVASADRSDDPTMQPTLRGEASGSTARGSGFEAPRALPRGTSIGRYVILARVGSGSMGVVYAAYDPHLDRRVALKLLTARLGDGSRGHARTFAEAQALAKLAHPNVVVVHDVGMADTAVERSGETLTDPPVFLAMEFIEGRTLGAWLAEAKRSWSEVLAVFVQAGRGLAAAHEAGLIHRDFKPENLMIAESGRVVVMDFGLARTIAQDELPGPDESGADVLHTMSGRLAGTPAYMPAEAYRDDPRVLGPWSDQFSFCVALYEALYGMRPFAADSLIEQMRAVTEGRVLEPPAKSGVPGWLHAVIVRGLAVEPNDRHASMDALLAALDRERPRRARWPIVAVATAGVAGIVGWAASGKSAEAQCEDAAAQIDARWNDDRRERIASAFAGTNVAAAPGQFANVATLLDEHAQAWRDMYVDACAATHVRREQSGPLLDARMRCLRERSDRLEALLVELETVDAALVTNAVTAAHRLPAIADCREPPVADREAARSAEADDPRVVSARAALATARARADAGRFPAAIAALDDARAQLGDAPFPRVLAQVQLERGRVLESMGERPEAEAVLREVVVVATGADDPATAAGAWIELVDVVGVGTDRSDEGLALVLAADAAIAAAGDAPELRRRRLVAESLVWHGKGNPARALELTDEALAIAVEHGADPTVSAILHNNRGNMLEELGRYDEAERDHERALEIDIATYGERHPSVATDLVNLAHDVSRHDLGRARGQLERARSIREEFLGPRSFATGEAVLSLATLAADEDDMVEARARGEEALAILREALPADHMHIAAVHNHLGIVANRSGRQNDALAHYAELERIVRKNHGDEHPYVATALQNRGNVLRGLGDYVGALPLYEQALALKEKVRGPTHPSLAPLLAVLARTRVELGRVAEARVAIDRALALRRAGEPERDELAWAEYIEGRVMFATPGADAAARERAVQQVRRALATLRDCDGDNTGEIADIEGWLAAQDR